MSVLRGNGNLGRHYVASDMASPSAMARSVVVMSSVRRLKRQLGRRGAVSMPSVAAVRTRNQYGEAMNAESLETYPPNPWYRSEVLSHRRRTINVLGSPDGVLTWPLRSKNDDDKFPRSDSTWMYRSGANIQTISSFHHRLRSHIALNSIVSAAKDAQRAMFRRIIGFSP